MNKPNEKMSLHVEHWSASGQNKAAYCRSHGLNYHTFVYHCKRTTQELSVTGFTLLSPKPSTDTFKFHLPNGCYFSLPEDCSLTVLQKLVRLC